MMVSIAQSDSNEDSQGRQLRINKKLSKAISSVPRSRFQKPRPNLPGSKRTDSNSVSAAVLKPVSRVQNAEKTEVTALNTSETCQNLEENKDSSAISIAVSTLVKTENCDTELSTKDLPETTKSSSALLNTDVVSIEDSADSTPVLNSNETFEKKAETTTLSTEEIFCKEDSSNAVLIIKDSTENKDDSSSNTTLSDETVQEVVATPSAIIANVTAQKENRCTSTLSTESLLNSTEPERNDINIPSSVTDRSFKYPHLTSILSKKRTEPKKEVQRKRRKKFKKGDVAPERSKMTMADFIYWNPTNTEQPVKSSSIVNEITNPTVEEEEELVDGDVKEDNVCDSVPKLCISDDGQIGIDKTSLVISRNIPEPTVTEVIRKDETTYSSFRKRPLTKHWSPKDTTIFYKALSLVGTDFGLMEKIFPLRTRRELKQKFKREEKFHIDLINRAMYESQLTFDATTLEELIEELNNVSNDDMPVADEDDFENAEKGKKKPSNKKQKPAKKTKLVDPDFSDSTTEELQNETIEVILNEVGSKRKRKTKKLPDDFVHIDDIENTVESDSEDSDEKKAKKCQDGDDVSLNKEISVDISNAVSETISLAVHNDEEECIEYVDITSTTDPTSMSDVMAYEVVASLCPRTKRRQNTNSAILPLGLSSTNYTPSLTI